MRHPGEFSFPRCEDRPGKPVKVTYAMGGAVPGDVVWTTFAIPLVVSQRFIDVLQDNRFNGWGTYPIKVYNKAGELVPGYQGFCISGRCGPILYEKSEIVYEEMPGGRVPRYRGMYFNPDTWDGSDFFMPTTASTGQKFVLESVKKALEKAKVKNLVFERLNEIVLPVQVNPRYKEIFKDR
jgi:hypothetical protein